jgi:hypothetical protein
VRDQFVALTAEQVTLYEAMVRETMEAIATKEGIERAGLVFKQPGHHRPTAASARP